MVSIPPIERPRLSGLRHRGVGAAAAAWPWIIRLPGAAADALAAERERWILWRAAALAYGAAAYFALPDMPGAAAFWAALCLAAVAGGALMLRAGTVPAFLGGLLLAAAVGAGAADFRVRMVEAPVIADRLGPVSVSGRILEAEGGPGGPFRVTLGHLAIDRLTPEDTPHKIRVTSRIEKTAPPVGSRIETRAILLPPPEPAAPGAFDFGRQAYFQRLGAVGFTVAPMDAAREGNAGNTLGARIGRLRQALSQRIQDGLEGRRGALAAALITGDRGALDPADVEALRAAGLGHLLAISGLHMAMVGGLIFFALRFLLAAWEYGALRYPIKKWAAGAALIGSLAYLVISGASIPTQRACVMIGLMFVAIILDRPALSMRLVAVAATLILLMRPEAVLEPGFQMSFGAVIALIAVAEWTARRPRGDEPETYSSRPQGRVAAIAGKLVKGAGGVALTSGVAGLATAPFAVFHFQRLARFGLAANMIAIPVMGLVVMPAAIAAVCLMPLGAEGPALTVMGWGLGIILWAAHGVADWPMATASHGAWPGSALALMGAGLLWLCLWARPWRWAGLGLAALAMFWAQTGRPPDILIDAEARLVAVRGADGDLYLTTDRRARFEAEMWLRRDGSSVQPEEQVLGAAAPAGYGSRGPSSSDHNSAGPDPLSNDPLSNGPLNHDPARAKNAPQPRLRCDVHGCLIAGAHMRTGRTLHVAISDSLAAHGEDCARAEIVISRVPLRRPCTAPSVVIDWFDLWRHGAHSITWTAQGPHIARVSEMRGGWPWNRLPGVEDRIRKRPRNKAQ